MIPILIAKMLAKSIFSGSLSILKTSVNQSRTCSISLSSFVMEKWHLKLIKTVNHSFVRLIVFYCVRIKLRFSFIVTTEQPTAEDYQEGLKKRQIVMEFDIATWKVRCSHSSPVVQSYTHCLVQRAIEVFNITEAVIPTRPKAQTGINGKWYG